MGHWNYRKLDSSAAQMREEFLILWRDVAHTAPMGSCLEGTIHM